MHVALRERKRDRFRIETLFNGLHEITLERPVIATVTPDADQQVDRTVRQLANGDQWFRVAVAAFVGSNHFVQDIHGLVDVIVVTDAEHEIEPAR